MGTSLSSLPSLSARLAALRESKNPSIKSTDSSSTSLATFLSIYNKAKDIDDTVNGSCYTDYMAGAKLLYNWLSPIDIPVLPNLPTNVPAVFHQYEVNQLADILTGKSNNYNNIHEWICRSKYIAAVIIYLTCKEVYYSYEDDTSTNTSTSTK